MKRGMGLDAVQDSYERAAKKQKLSSSRYQELIDQVAHEIKQALASIQTADDSAVVIDQKSVLTELKAKLQAIGSQYHFAELLREVNTYLSKHQKVLEKTLDPDISKAYRNVDFDSRIVNQIIINHFYREGLFDVVDCLIREADELEPTAMRLQFHEIQQILEAVKHKNLEPALNWVSANQQKLKESGLDLHLKLNKLRFVDILQNQGQGEALKYVRTYLAPLASDHMNEIQRLVGSLLWAGKLGQSPYADLIDPIHWKRFSEELIEIFFNFSGQPFWDPLKVSFAAGLEGLPTLLKLAKVMAGQKQEWQDMKQLPVSLELGDEFQFHSAFVCPVSRDQGTEENPPMLLPCKHVLCKQSISRLTKGNTRNFKCPYCPGHALMSHCRRLYI